MPGPVRDVLQGPTAVAPGSKHRVGGGEDGLPPLGGFRVRAAPGRVAAPSLCSWKASVQARSERLHRRNSSGYSNFVLACLPLATGGAALHTRGHRFRTQRGEGRWRNNYREDNSWEQAWGQQPWAFLTGCATPGTASVNTQPVIPAAAGETITLTYWAWLKDFQNVADIWNAANPHVQVKVEWIPGGNAGGYQKLYSALAAGGGPDLAQVELRSIPEFMLVNGLVDLSRYGAQEYAHPLRPHPVGPGQLRRRRLRHPPGLRPDGHVLPACRPGQGGRARHPTTWDEWAAVGA